MKYLSEYLLKLLKTWIFYLGIIPTFYDFINTYFKFNFEFSNKFLLIWANFWIIYASYEIWKKEKEEKNKILEEINQLKNSIPTYEVKLILKKFEFEEVRKFEEHQTKYLQKAKKQLEVLEDKNKLNDLKGYEIEELFDFLPLESQYDLKKYQEDLKTFIYKLKNLQIDENIKNANFYNATIQISNIGTKSDEDIYCAIELGEENFAFNDIEEFRYELKKIKSKYIPSIPEFPKPIKIFKANNIPKIKNINVLRNPIINIANPNIKELYSLPFAKLNNLHPPYFFVDEHSLRIRELNLNVGLVHKRNFYLILKDDKQITYFVTSKNLKEPQKGFVKVEYAT